MREKVVGLVVGSRKCGTTWLYENFKNDPELCVSRTVKESGFFARPDDRDFDYYDSLYPDSSAKRVEVDSSLVYSNASAGKIHAYRPDMNIVLILRHPVEYTVSRFSHLLRKGQLDSDNFDESILDNEILQQELDYPAMIQRFHQFERHGHFFVVPYLLLGRDPQRFYDVIKKCLIGGEIAPFKPTAGKVNAARESRWTFGTWLLSSAARHARRHRLHFAANWAKRLGIHRLLEKTTDQHRLDAMKERVSEALEEKYRLSIEIYNNIEKQFVD